MPQVPHDYEINFWIGTGETLHAVRMEQFPNRELAIVAGVNALFEWAKADPDKSIPQAALDYWENHRQNPSLTFQDVQSELEGKWGIQFGAKQIDIPTPAPARKPVDPKAETRVGQGNRRLDRDMVPADDIDIVTLLKQRYASQCSRVKAIDAEIAESRKLRAEVEHDIARLESMLTAVATIDPPKENTNGHRGRRKRVDQAGGKDSGEVKQARRGRPRRDEAGRAGGIAAGFSGGVGTGEPDAGI